MTPTATRPRKTPLFSTDSLWVVEFKMSGWAHWQRSAEYHCGGMLIPPMAKTLAEQTAAGRQKNSLSLIYRARELPETC